MSQRQQCVSIDGVTSSLAYVTCGVPQGSIIGPLLFLIYNNDIMKCSPSLDKILFADDTIENTKFLLVVIDNKLSWINHNNYISSRISRGLGILGRVRRYLPHNILLILYYTLIYPYLSYCCNIWGYIARNTMNRLFVL